ncbi:ATP-binding cassette domain-containing protein [Paenibacillus sp. FSL R7-0331]|uniref:ATP-binding cassette domain-containing protein n=1 Tax=Paenibacillus sp. FSL R7-0331 TaxID=1536773 RepID=UPI0004F8CBAE|nr:ABC transporter ATP-binding protein [Paenibacillus sp. FSL R7-0331]AIQ52497.1 peptide ABC transporter ATPase [Paenibacillus sp. FSL R7-0331]
MLEFNDITIRTSSRTLVDKVSLSVQPGEWHALVGQSGSGKSLLSRSAGQLLPPGLSAEGSIMLEGTELLGLKRSSLRSLLGRRMSYIFQDYQAAFAPFRTIGQHFREAIATHDKQRLREAPGRTSAALESVGLEGSLASRYPFQLSGGQLQRASIALALLFSPDVLIADEVTTALDSVSGHRVLSLLNRLRLETGCSILFITHDWRHVRRYTDRIAVMKDGRIVESGGTHRVLDHPRHEYTRRLIAAAPVLSHLPSGLQEVQP